MTTDIHPSAVVEQGADLGEDVTVGPFSYVQDGATVGPCTQIGPHVTIFRHATLGARCEVHAGSVIGDTPQDLSFEGAESYVTIGDECNIREGVTVNRGTDPGSSTVIGNKCFLMAFSHFAHNVKLGDGVIVANGTLCAGHVEVGANAFLSGHSGVHQFARIGRLVMVSPYGAIAKDVPPFCLTNPNSRSQVRGLNVVGMKRSGMNQQERSDVKQAFRTLYHSGLNVSQAVEKIRLDFDAGPALEFAEFIEASERGICSLGAKLS